MVVQAVCDAGIGPALGLGLRHVFAASAVGPGPQDWSLCGAERFGGRVVRVLAGDVGPDHCVVCLEIARSRGLR